MINKCLYTKLVSLQFAHKVRGCSFHLMRRELCSWHEKNIKDFTFLAHFFFGVRHVSPVCLFILRESCEHTHTHFLVSCAGYYPVCLLQDLYNLPISYSYSTCQDVAGRKRFLALTPDPRGTERWHPWANVSVMSWVLRVWHWAQHNEWIIVYVMIGVVKRKGWGLLNSRNVIINWPLVVLL